MEELEKSFDRLMDEEHGNPLRSPLGSSYENGWVDDSEGERLEWVDFSSIEKNHKEIELVKGKEILYVGGVWNVQKRP